MSGVMEIGAALRAHLIAQAPGAALNPALVAWENKKFTRPASGLWYRTTLLPGVPRTAGFGEGAPNRHVGVFHVGVFGEPDRGDGLVTAEAERIASAFKRGTVLVRDGVTVVIERAYREAGDVEPDFFMVPVVITWRADVAN